MANAVASFFVLAKEDGAISLLFDSCFSKNNNKAD